MIPIVQRSLQRTYIGRKLRYRNYKKARQQRLSAAVEEFGIYYNKFVWGLGKSNIKVNKKILSELAVNEPYSFRAVLDEV